MADKEKTVHPIVGRSIAFDADYLKYGSSDDLRPSHIGYLLEDSYDEREMTDLAEAIRKLNLRAGVRKPSVEINDSAAKILKSQKVVNDIDKETFDKYFSLPPEIRQLITKREEATSEKKGIA